MADEFEWFTGEEADASLRYRFPAQRCSTELEWDDLSVDPEALSQLQHIVTWITHRPLLEDSKLLKRMGPGCNVLFHGPPGTGKTLAASSIGKRTGLPVYRIDLTQLVSKYIGETEKNLAGIFNHAEQQDWILFFDEADALFSKRTETSSANGRAANQHVGYLLQRIEAHPGVVILAANMKSNIDDAFLRRFQSVIGFRRSADNDPRTTADGQIRPGTSVERMRTASRMQTGSGVFDEIPIVDVSPARHDTINPDFCREFTDICHHVGFALITDHGIEQTLIDDVFSMMHDFFALSTDDKLRIDKNNSPQMRGWEPVGAETTNNAADIREQIDVWTEWPTTTDGPDYNLLHGPNQWLPDTVLAGHRELSLRWISACADLADRLMAALAIGLGFEAGYFRSMFGEQTMSLAKFIHYPPTPAGGAGVNPHHDAGFLTVLAPGPTAGLQVQNPVGDWVDVPVIKGTLVINLGEMLQSMTGNYLVATPHRVITADERWSAGYFHGPSLDTSLAPIELPQQFVDAVNASPHHASAGFMPTPEEASAGTGAMGSSHRPGTYGEQLWNYFNRSYSEAMQRHHGAAANGSTINT